MEGVCTAPAPPTVWVLLGKGVGGNRQMTNLADALGWPYETKQLFYNVLNRCPNMLLGASIVSVDRRHASLLTPPWPDVVIAASRRSAPVARWIKKQSGGSARLVHLMHTQAPLEHFDLIVTMPQYRLPVRPNVQHIAAPLIRIDADALAAAAAVWAPRLAHLPRPYTALLVGGNSSSYELDPATGARLGREATACVRTEGGSLLVSTSARTPGAAADALVRAVDCPAYHYRWLPSDPDNPYLAYLALAHQFIVTVDSASLLAEACAMNKPVHLFEWPRRPPARIKRILERWSGLQANGVMSAAAPRLRTLYDRLVYWGLLKPPRDFGAYCRALMARGLVTRLGERPTSERRQPLDDMERTVASIKKLVAS